MIQKILLHVVIYGTGYCIYNLGKLGGIIAAKQHVNYFTEGLGRIAEKLEDSVKNTEEKKPIQ